MLLPCLLLSQVINTEDLRIESISDVITPAALHDEFPISDSVASLVHETRAAIYLTRRKSESSLMSKSSAGRESSAAP